MEYFIILIIMFMFIRVYYPFQFNLFLLDLYFKLLEIQRKLDESIAKDEREQKLKKEKKENDNK